LNRLPLLPLTFVAFIGFLTMGLALPILPLHVHDTLGMSPTIVGIVAGSQFAAALLSRVWSGMLTDTKGAKLAMQVGLLAASLGGVIYHASLFLLHLPAASVVVLIGGRLLIGCAESFIVTGALTWGVALIGPQNAGKVIAWVGIAIYGAYAAAAPVGVWLYSFDRFGGIATVTMLLPLLGLACVAPLAAVKPPSARRVPFYKVIGTVILPGVGLALIGAGMGSITAFIALLFGLLIGSFLNVCVYRLPLGTSIVWPASRCRPSESSFTTAPSVAYAKRRRIRSSSCTAAQTSSMPCAVQDFSTVGSPQARTCSR